MQVWDSLPMLLLFMATTIKDGGKYRSFQSFFLLMSLDHQYNNAEGKNMYYTQNGWNVTIARMLGYIFMLGISSCLLLYGVGMWFSLADGSSFASLLAPTFFYLLFVVGMAIFAVYNLWKFP